MRTNETFHAAELAAADIKKGDVISIVAVWNFWRGDRPEIRHRPNSKVRTPEHDIYTFETWTVAARGKQIMRLERIEESEGGTIKQTFKNNVYLMERGGVMAFQSFVCRPGDEEKLYRELVETDPHSTETTELLTRHEAIQRINF